MDASADPREFLLMVYNLIVANFNVVISSIIIVVVILILDRLLVRAYTAIARAAAFPKTMLKSGRNLIRGSLALIGIILVLGRFGYGLDWLGGVLSLLFGAIVGFASVNTIGNAISGLIILIWRPFKVGDRVRMLGTAGKELDGDVEEVSLMYTRVKTERDELIHIPNLLILQREVTNFSSLGRCVVYLEVGFDMRADARLVEDALIEAALKTDGILHDPPPYVRTSDLRAGVIVYQVNGYTDRPNQITRIKSSLRKSVANVFSVRGLVASMKS